MNLNKLIGILGIILMVTFALVAARNYFVNNVDDIKVNDEVENTGEEQVVTLTMKDYNYYPQVINLKYNVPTKIVVDTTKVRGCFSSIVIPEFGVRKTVTSKNNVIEFTPDKKGEFSFSCSMGMGFGKIIVN